MKKKKIAIVTNSMKGGGTERFVHYLLKHLENKYDIHLLLTESKIEYELPKNQKITYLNKNHDKIRNFTSIWEFPVFLIKIPVYARRLIRYCRKNEIETVVSFLERSNFTACFAKTLGFKGKIFVSERTHTPSFYTSSVRGQIGMTVVKFLYPKADAILTNSYGSETALRDECKIKNSYFQLRNMIDISEVDEKAKIPNELDLANKFTFVNLAGFREGKNHTMLIKAFAALDNPNTQLLLLGKGKTMDAAVSLVNKLQIADKVIFAGHAENPYNYLVKSDCFVLPTDFEGFPNVLIEALACGLPVISTDCKAGPRELLAEKQNYDQMLSDNFEICKYGILTPVGNIELMTAAMKKILDDEGLRNKYRSMARNRALDFDVKSVANDFCRIIEENK